MPAHHHADPPAAMPLLFVAALTLVYGALAARQRSRAGWNGWRAASFAAGSVVLALGLAPAYLPFAAGDLRRHMLQHLAIGMLAPIGWVMGAPMTLLLRSIPAAPARAMMRVLRGRVLRVIASPAAALLLEMGGMAALYFTPLYAQLTASPIGHYAMHVHFLAAGCLYCWVTAGPDPVPHRPSVGWRIIVLGIAIVSHSVIAQLLYAGMGVAVSAPPEQLRQGAELMYYGGDIAEILLACALVTTWRPARGRVALAVGSEARRRDRREDCPRTASG
jgi:putative membrane protein